MDGGAFGSHANCLRSACRPARETGDGITRLRFASPAAVVLGRRKWIDIVAVSR